MNKTTDEIQSTQIAEPSPSAAGFKAFRVNPVNPIFQPAISILTSQLEDYNSNIRNPFQSRSEKVITQNNTQYIPNLPQTPVPNSTVEKTNSNFPLTSHGTVFYQPESEYTKTLLNQVPDHRN